MYKKLEVFFSEKQKTEEKKEPFFTKRKSLTTIILCMVLSALVQFHHRGYLSSTNTYGIVVPVSFPIQEKIFSEKKESFMPLSLNAPALDSAQALIAPAQKETIISPSVEKPEVKLSSSVLGKEKGKIILIVAGLGLNNEYTKEALSLPSGITLGFSPYADDIDNWLKRAEEAGHDTLLHLPLEPASYPEEDAGPFALISRLSIDENQSHLLHVLDMAHKTKGLYSDPNEKFSFTLSQMGPVLRILKRENIPFIYGQSGSQNSVLIQYGAMIEHPVLAIDTIIDEETNGSAIKAALAKAEALAKNNGFAILYAHPYPVTLDAIKTWSNALQDTLSLVSVSSLFPQKNSHDASL